MTLQDCVWRGKFEICEAIEPVPDGKVLLNYIRQVSFTSKSTSLGCTGTVPHLKEQWHEIVDPFWGPKTIPRPCMNRLKRFCKILSVCEILRKRVSAWLLTALTPFLRIVVTSFSLSKRGTRVTRSCPSFI